MALLLTAPAVSIAQPDARSSDTTTDLTAADERRESDDERGDDTSGPAYQSLSTLGALALGVLGLLWVRRHTAEL